MGAVTGTLGANYVSKFNFGNKYGNQFLKPIFSNFSGEYLGDSDKIKSTIDNINKKGNLNENK